MVVAGIWILICVIAVPMAPRLTTDLPQISNPNQSGQGQPPPPPSGEKPASTAGGAGPEKSGSVPEPSSNPTEKPAAPAK